MSPTDSERPSTTVPPAPEVDHIEAARSVPDEFAVGFVEFGGDGTVVSRRVIDGRFTESRLTALNEELQHRGHRPVEQTTIEQVAALRNMASFDEPSTLGRSIGKVLSAVRRSGRTR